MPPTTRGKDTLRNDYLHKQKSDNSQKCRRAKKAVGSARPEPLPSAKVRLEIQRNRARQKKRNQRAKIKNDPVAYAAYCQKDRERKQKQKLKGKIKGVKDLPPRAQRAKRKYHREAKRASRARQKRFAAVSNGSDDGSIDLISAVSQLSLHGAGPSVASTTQKVSKQAKSSKKRESRKRRKCYTQINKLRSENVSLKKNNKSLQQRLNRLMEKLEKKKGRSLSPLPTVRRFLRDENTSMTEIEKKLLVAETLRRQYIHTYSEQKSEKVRQILSLSLKGGLVRKYKLINHVRQHYIDVQRNRTDEVNILHHRKAVKNANVYVEKQIITFLEENSDIDPGKNKYKKVNGERVQIRVLHASLVDLHKKFCSERGFKMSVSTLCKYRPVNFVAPSLNCRETCACISHLNFEFVIKSLHTINAISENSTYQVMRSLLCETPSINCFLRTCQECVNKEISWNSENIVLTSQVNYYQWISVRETRVSAKTKKNIEVNITRKEIFTASVEKIIELFNNNLKVMLTHEGRIFHQAKSFKELCQSIDENTLVLHIDWSENALCKLNKEVHRFHFGASRQQISLHTVMMYCNSYAKGFATASESLRHDACAVLAHLIKILNPILTDLPSIDSLHLKSDGPSTQYKNKTLIYLVTQILPNFFPQLKEITYSYSESGHSKGAADGIGAGVKRMADDYVKYGGDIPDFETFLTVVQNSSKNIQILSVNDGEISKIDDTLPTVIKSLAGIRQMFQFTWSIDNRYEVFFNSLSCFSCLPGSKCLHFHQGSINYETTSSDSNKTNKTSKKKRFVTNSCGHELADNLIEVPSSSGLINCSPCEYLDDCSSYSIPQKKKKMMAARNINASENITHDSFRKSSRVRKPKDCSNDYHFY